jgi:hypothetical protein
VRDGLSIDVALRRAIGLIWQVRDGLSIDVALRRALTNGHPVNEVLA